MATIPILKVKKFVDLLIAFIKIDYDSKTDKHKSFLYRVLGDNESDGWNFYKNGIAIFTRDGDDKRQLETRIGFDRSRAGLPTIHVREPAKNKGSFDGIGFMDDAIVVNESVGLDGNGDPNPSTISGTARKTFNSTFDIMITSGNSLECVLIQEVLESALLSAFDGLTINFFDLINFTSKELMMNDDTERNQLFIKSITLNIEYQKDGIPNLYTEENITKIQFQNPTLLDI
jgi:hypothetical protein